MKTREALLAFSLSFDYLRDKNTNKEGYILGLSKFYVGLLWALTITLAINILVSFSVYFFLKNLFDFEVIHLILISTAIIVILAYVISSQMQVNHNDYQNGLSKFSGKEVSGKAKLIWKYNLLLMLLIFTNLVPLFILGIVM